MQGIPRLLTDPTLICQIPFPRHSIARPDGAVLLLVPLSNPESPVPRPFALVVSSPSSYVTVEGAHLGASMKKYLNES
jgi:hypothetical protein